MSGQHDDEREEAPKKVSRTTPNLANVLGDWLVEHTPALQSYEHAWVTGSSVWSLICGEDRPPTSDLDVFFTNRPEYTRFVAYLAHQQSAPVEERPKRASSREGVRLHTDRGWFDVWLAEEGETPIAMLASYPSDSHAHCRAAYQPKSKALIVIANEKATADTEPEWCERQSVWWVERAIRKSQKSRAA